MKQLIRNGTFETNSSSMHSLVVTKSAKKYPECDLKLGFYGGKKYNLFSWDTPDMGRAPFKVMRTPRDKLMYYVGWYIGSKHEYDKIPMIKDFISKQINLPVENISIVLDNEIDDEYYKYPHVYPNDTGEDVFECLEEHNVPFEEFILDPRYTVIIDGDEYREFAQLFDARIITKENIEYISSGIDFWDSSCNEYNMFFVNKIADTEGFQFEDMTADSNTVLTDPFITHIKLQDELGVEPDEAALDMFKELILNADKQRETPLYKELQICEDEKRVEKYDCIKDIFDEIFVVSKINED